MRDIDFDEMEAQHEGGGVPLMKDGKPLRGPWLVTYRLQPQQESPCQETSSESQSTKP